MDKEVFKEQITELYPRLRRSMTLYLAGSSIQVEDLLQETFLKAWSHLDSFQDESRLYTWIYSIARNLAIDEFRKRKNSIPISQVPVEEYPVSGNPKPEEEAGGEIGLLRKAIEDLPELLRSIVIMKTADGLSYPEIAEVTGLNEQTVKNRMFRARKELAERLKQMGYKHLN